MLIWLTARREDPMRALRIMVGDGNCPTLLPIWTDIHELGTNGLPNSKTLGTGSSESKLPQMKVTSLLISSAVLVPPPLSPKN